MLRRRSPRVSLKRPDRGSFVARGRGIELEAEAGGADGPMWQMVALEGEFRGYAGGLRPFAFTRQTFDEIVTNFRQHPSYSAGPDGIGQNGVIAWDFHHASEQDPTSGVIPMAGAPAQGWVLEVEVREGAKGAELWALTKWLPTAKEYVRTGAYKWASVSVVFNAVDGVSGKEVGAMLTSIALTNQPFIEGMQELAASAAAARSAMLGYDVWLGDIVGPEDVVEHLRKIFGMSATASLADLLKEIGALKAQIAAGMVPVGVDIDDILGAMRRVLNLRTLASMDEVFAEVELLVSRLLESGAVGPDQQTPAPPAQPQPPAEPGAPALDTISVSNEGRTMELLKVLATALGVRENAEAVTSAVESLVAMRGSITSAIGLSKDANDRVILDRLEGPGGIAKLAAQRGAAAEALLLVASTRLPVTKAERVTAAATLEDKLMRIFRAANIENPEQHVQSLVASATAFAELQEVMPELEGLRKQEAERSEEEVAEDVAAAMQRQGFELDASGQPKTEAGKTVAKGLRAQHVELGRKTFRSTFDLDRPADEHVQLTRTYAGGPQGRPAAEPGSGARIPEPPAGKIDLSKYEGANDSERATNYVLAEVAGADKWPWEKVCTTAHTLRRQGKFVNMARFASN